MEDFVRQNSKLYYYENLDYLGKKERKEELDTRIYCTQKEIEQIAKDVLDADEPLISWKIIAWKAGKLKYDSECNFKTSKDLPFVSDDKKFAWDGKNRMGKKISEKKHIETFIEKVNEYSKKPSSNNGFKFKDYGSSEFMTAYKRILKLEEECNIKNIGAVYTITLIHFLSKGNFPIYDRFAHIAAKALYLGANPADIWVGDAPSKDDKTKVYNMYFEYCWLLKRIFKIEENCYISREKDQALWVYGHSKNEYHKRINFPKTYSDRSLKET